MREKVEDLVASVLRLVGEMWLYKCVHGRAAALEGFHQVGALVAELQLVEGEDGHGGGAQRLAHLLDTSGVRRAELLVPVQQADLELETGG